MLSTAEVAKILGVSKAYLRVKFDGTLLHPIEGDVGAYGKRKKLYDPDEVEAVAAMRSER